MDQLISYISQQDWRKAHEELLRIRSELALQPDKAPQFPKLTTRQAREIITVLEFGLIELKR